MTDFTTRSAVVNNYFTSIAEKKNLISNLRQYLDYLYSSNTNSNNT